MVVLPRLGDCAVSRSRPVRTNPSVRCVLMVKKHAPRSTMDFPVINANASGCDVGSEWVYIAVPPDRSDTEVRRFRTFTQDLREAVQWMLACGITTVAMESTSVYWIPFTQLLEESRIQVFLVNPRHVKNVPAAFKTDNRDSRWLRNLHAVGLLSASFRPEQAVCKVRSLARHRDNLTKQASRCVLHMQKALSQMNILLHEVIADVTGVSGLAVLDAILAGNRSPEHLARLFSPRVKATDEEIKKALVGDWRDEHLFTLRQSLASWRHFQSQIAECDTEISRLLSEFGDPPDPPDPTDTFVQAAAPEAPVQTEAPLEGDTSATCMASAESDASSKPKRKKPGRPANPTGTRAQERKKRDLLIRLFGIDITQIPGIGVGCAELFFTELGRDLSRFHSAQHLASWLGLAPNNNESGGKILSRKVRRMKNRLATQLRLCANTLGSTNTYLGAYLRKMKSRLGAPKGITATAHKLAVILYTVITRRTPYDETVFARQEERHREKRLNYLKQQAAAMGFDFVPRECVS